MKAQLTPIAAAAALLLLHTATVAQSAAQPTAAADDKVERVEVIGIRASQQKSLQTKRDADGHVDVITAEDIGKMPDKNVADSLQRVPGVTISSAGANEGGFDENDRVSMRGTNPSLTQTLINGHPVASGDWFVLNQSDNAGRSVSFSMLPSEIVGSVVVHKSSQASDVEGGVVGNVNIITRKPLEFKKPFTLEMSAGVVYADLPEQTDPQFSALLNWRNDGSTLGVMAQVFSEKRHLRRDGVEVLGYNQIAADSEVAKAHPDLAGVWYPRSTGVALFEQVRERQGGMVDVQFKPLENWTTDLSGFLSKLNATNYNRNYLLHAPFFLNGGAGQSPDAGYVVRNNTLVSATFSPALKPDGVTPYSYGTYDMLSRPNERAETSFINWDNKVRVSDDFTFSTKLGQSTGIGETPEQNQASWDVGGGGSWHLNGVDSAPSFSIGTPANSPAGSVLDWLWGAQNVRITDTDTWAQFDGEWFMDAGVFRSLKFGLRAAEHKRESDGVIAQGPNWAADPFNLANWPLDDYKNYPDNFGKGLGGNFPRNVWYLTPAQLADANDRLANRDPIVRAYKEWDFGLNEKSNSAYVQANLEGDHWRGDVGVRFVETKEHVLKFLNIGFPTTPLPDNVITGSAFGNYVPTTTDHTYHDILPSLNLRFDIAKDLVGRVAASKTMTRPDYSALAGALSLSPPANQGDVGGGSGSNPDLKPIRSTNVDASLEWYFAPRSLLSAGVFYMNLQSYVGLGQSAHEYLTFDQAHPDGYMAPYVLTVPVNSSGKVSGIELAYEQPFFSNFGVAANYTYTDAKDKDDKPIVGASRDTYNLSGYFENDIFNARLAYNYRSHFYSGLDRATAFNQADFGSLSASLGYKFSEDISLSFDARNLNNPKLKYYAENQDQPRSIYMNGRQYYLTLRWKL
ncbi:TonB-dependent receptor [Ideonella sp. DXS29W]|uniref:TonB-dependent receptor n=1 Tax=Ideonella lacteola TaxID=2984193 RepID=A0ABU9BPA9_9BURK